MARKRRKSRRRKSRKSVSSRKALNLSGNKKLSEKEIIEKFRLYLEEEDVDPDDIRKSFEEFKKKYGIEDKDE